MTKRIFYLSDIEFRVVLVKGKTLTEIKKFQTSNNAEFANYLSNAPKTPTYWLVDTTQEEYQITSMPHVRGKDHRHLIAQKIKRLFKDTPYTHSTVQGRQTQGRRDDQVLFSALNNPAFLQPWLDLIMAHKVPLIGIYSLPLLSQHLLKYLPKAPYTLLVAHTPPIRSHNPVGLRQSFFINQKLQFSRLIPLNTLAPQEYADYVLTQITTTRHYLDNALMLPESLSVIILTDTPLLSAINTDTSLFNLHLLDNRDFAHKLKLDLQGERAWYLHHFVAFQMSRHWHTTNHYAAPADTRYLTYRKVRIAIYLISILLLSGAATASLITLEKALIMQQKGNQIAEKTTKRQTELEQLNKKTPNLPLDILLIRSIVELSHHLKAHHLSPRPAWEKLSHILSRHPNLYLERLEWGVGHSRAEIFRSNLIPTLNPTKNPLNELEPSKHIIEGMRLHGKIWSRSHKSNDQNTLQIFDPFVIDLRTDFWVIDVLLAPYDPKQILQGQIGSQVEKVEGEGEGNAPFVIDILIKHSY